jgi:hypothetical protein
MIRCYNPTYNAPTWSGGHFYPPADNVYDLGHADYSWRNAHIQTAVYATSCVGNWSPSDDDTYWLGTSTLGWKGLHLPDTLVTDDTGYVLLRNNANSAYVGLKAGAAEFSGIVTFKSDVVNEGYLGLLVTDTDGDTEGEIWYDASENTVKVCTGSVDSVVLLTATQELDNKTLDSSVAKGTWTASGTWTIPAVTLNGAVSCGDNNFTGIGDMTFTNGSIIKTGATDSDTLIFQAVDNDGAEGAYLEVAKMTSANDPYFSAGGSQEFKFYNSGIADLGSGAITNVNIDSGDISGVTISGSLTWSAAQTFGAYDVTFNANVIIDSTTTGADSNSPLLYLRGNYWNDPNNVEVEATLNLVAGADPYLRISVDDGGATPASVAVFDIHDTIMVCNVNGFSFATHTDANDTLVFQAYDVDGGSYTSLVTLTAADIPTLGLAGVTSLVAGGNLDIGAYDFRAATLTADGLTSGRVVFAGANGVLSDDSDFTFATDTLTVTKIGAFQATGAINFNTQAMTNVDIDSGAIDGVTIGAAAAPTVTDLGSVATCDLNGGTLGGMTLDGTLTMGEVGIQLDHTITTNQNYSGIITTGTAGETVAKGEVLMLQTDDKWDKAQANSEAAGYGMLGLCVVGGNDTDTITILLLGYYYDTGFSFGNGGQPLYLSDTAAGDFIATKPDTTNDIVRIVAYQHDDANTIYFNPDGAYVTIA